MASTQTSEKPVKTPFPHGREAISSEAVAADQRRRLLEALPRAVAENGFEATTVEHIVKLGGVRRNSFYEQFADKQDCFAAAYEIAQERLLGVITFQCYTRSGLADRLGGALDGALDLLAANPSFARLVVIEAPGAGMELAARHQEWLDRYSRLLGLAAVGSPGVVAPRPALESAVLGAVVSRIKQLILAGQTPDLPSLRPELVRLMLSYYDSAPPAAEGAESSQPQSPGRRAVLEPA